jgi:MoaA/NifB/PqqE/SkfB family radical SAM enzyme
MKKLPAWKWAQIARYVMANKLVGHAVYPFYASLKITDRCEFQCPFCNVWKFPAPDEPTDKLKAILANLGRSSILMTSFEGGEPLLRDDIADLLEFASRQPYYVLFTTSQRNLFDYPLGELTKFIDFFHVSIDEGHDNLAMFELLPELVKYPVCVCVQTVVRNEDLPALPEKVEICQSSGSKILIMPAVHLKKTADHFPNFDRFETQVLALRRKYPGTVITPRNYFKEYRKGRCSTASIIIDADGNLFYPCRTMMDKAVNLVDVNLMDFLKSIEADNRRKLIDSCSENCGWYQYFATHVYTSFSGAWDAIRPHFRHIISDGRRKNCAAVCPHPAKSLSSCGKLTPSSADPMSSRT